MLSNIAKCTSKISQSVKRVRVLPGYRGAVYIYMAPLKFNLSSKLIAKQVQLSSTETKRGCRVA